METKNDTKRRRRRNARLPRHLVLLMFAWSLLALPNDISAQAPRVQFIHASPYAEAREVDVYRDGELWLDDFGFTEARPLEDWPDSREIRLTVSFADSEDDSRPFFQHTLNLAPRASYFILLGGDPLRRSDEQPFNAHIEEGVLETSPFGAYPAVQGISLIPDAPRFGKYWRGIDEDRFTGRLTSVYPDTYDYGMFQGYVQAPSVLLEGDLRAELGDEVELPFPLSLADTFLRTAYGDADEPVEPGGVFSATVLGFAHRDTEAFIIVTTGFVHPPRPGDAPITEVIVTPDGVVEPSRSNTARVQWINNSPYAESEVVDIYVNGLLVVDDLPFRSATPFVELPAGLRDETAPTLTIAVTPSQAAGAGESFRQGNIKLSFGDRYVAVIGGDPLMRTGQPLPELHMIQGVAERSDAADSTAIVLIHGAPDVRNVTVGYLDASEPLWRSVSYGSGTTYRTVAAGDDTLYVENALEGKRIAAFHADLASRSWADSALVLLTSGFESPPRGVAGANSTFELIAAPPGGGRLVVLGKEGPPGWWTNPWTYVFGMLGITLLTLAGNWVRISRLRARERALRALVEERTEELRKEKRHTEAQARRLQELDEAKNQFFTNISHEFRTPLTLILGPVQDAIDGRLGPVHENLRKQLMVMRRSSRRLLRLVNQLLDLSRLESGDLVLKATPGDLAFFTRELTQSFVPSSERAHIDLTFEADCASLVVDFDSDAVEKILSNLVANALKFTPANGHVRVALRQAEDDVVEITVSDTGLGITREDQERIFERFHQADTTIRRHYEGSGVGLALAKELTELHGGLLGVESEPGKGSTFTVRLPLRRSSESRDALSGPSQPHYAHAFRAKRGEGEPEVSHGYTRRFVGNSDGTRRATVLVVEDNADVRTFLRVHLETEWAVIEAGDGEAGFKAALEHEPDLIISDVMMPGMDGYEMCRRIRASESLRHVPVIMLTAKATEADALEGLGSGADDYITKPFSILELEAKIEHIIQTRQELRDRFSREIVVKPADITITPEEEGFLEHVIERVNQHLGDSAYSADWLAEEVGLSRRQLDRRVRSVSGKTTADLIRDLRLQRASQLLRAHACTVSEVAYSVGFKSPAHFSRVFRQAYGVAPSEVTNGESEPDTLAG